MATAYNLMRMRGLNARWEAEVPLFNWGSMDDERLSYPRLGC